MRALAGRSVDVRIAAVRSAQRYCALRAVDDGVGVVAHRAARRGRGGGGHRRQRRASVSLHLLGSVQRYIARTAQHLRAVSAVHRRHGRVAQGTQRGGRRGRRHGGGGGGGGWREEREEEETRTVWTHPVHCRRKAARATLSTSSRRRPLVRRRGDDEVSVVWSSDEPQLTGQWSHDRRLEKRLSVGWPNAKSRPSRPFSHLHPVLRVRQWLYESAADHAQLKAGRHRAHKLRYHSYPGEGHSVARRHSGSVTTRRTSYSDDRGCVSRTKQWCFCL